MSDDDYFCVGRPVRSIGYDEMILQGLVTGRSGESVSVVYYGNLFPYTYRLEQIQKLFEPLCKNCGMAFRDHADRRKCLYAPGSWE